MKVNESLLIGVAFSSDSEVMIVGRQKDGVLSVVNAFSGEEAVELYKKLTTINEKKKENV